MWKRRKLSLNKGRITFIAVLTAIVVLVSGVYVGHTILTVNRRIRQSCFDELTDTTKQLAEQLHMSIRSDHTTLSVIATIIANHAALNDAELCRILNSYGFDSSYISYLEILRPDNTMLDADGTVRDVSSALDFETIMRAGDGITGISQSTRDPNALVLRHAIPILKDDRPAYILFGVVRLSELAERFRTNLYGGHAYVYIMDGTTGDFILDTWHKTLGNIVELGERKMMPKSKPLDVAIAEMRGGIGGEIGFQSRTTGGNLYMRYEPLGVNNWTVLVTVEERYALEKSQIISVNLYRMAGLVGALMLLYVVCVFFSMLGAYRQVKKLGTEDQSTGLLNRNAFSQFVSDRRDKQLPSVACVYVDVNGLHAINNQQGHDVGDEMLRFVADALKTEFRKDALFRVGGDEFVAFSLTEDENACAERMRRVAERVAENGYSISYGVVRRTDETGLSRIVHEADERMLARKNAYYMKHDRRKR